MSNNPTPTGIPTPRSDAESPVWDGFPSTVSRDFARQLERENFILTTRIKELEELKARAAKSLYELSTLSNINYDTKRLIQTIAERLKEA